MRHVRQARLLLDFCHLEERAVPANDLLVVDDLTPSLNVEIKKTGNTINIRTTDAGAQVSVTDIRDALLRPGVKTVVLSTAVAPGETDANENGDLFWDASSVLNFTGINKGVTLRLETDSGAAVGDILLDGTGLVGTVQDTFNLEIDSSGPGGNVSFLASLFAPVNINLPGASDITIDAGTGNFTFQDGIFDSTLLAGGALTITAANLDLGSQYYNAGGNLTINGPATSAGSYFAAGGMMHFANDLTLAPSTFNVFATSGANSVVTFDGALDGAADITLDVRRAIFEQNTGRIQPLNSINLIAGALEHGPHTIDVGQITISFGFLTNNSPAVFGAGTGMVTVTNSIDVNTFGVISPNGIGSVGVTNITGNVNFYGGNYTPDLGPVSDVLNITGTVDVTAGNLGGGLGMGTLSAPATVLNYGTLIGEFANAPEDAPVVVGTDAVTVDAYAPGVILKPLAASNLPGNDWDGTGYTVKLTGGGELVTFQDAGLVPSVVVRNSTPLSVLTITTKANASNDLIAFNDIAINGSMNKITAAKVDILGSVQVTGTLKGATLRNMDGHFRSGGTGTDALALTMNNVGFQSSIVTASKIASLKVAQGLGAFVQAPELGTLQATNIYGSVLIAGPIGTFKVSGNHFGTLSGTSLTNFDVQNHGGQLTIAGLIKNVKATTLNGPIVAGGINTLRTNMLNAQIISAGAVGTMLIRGDATANLSATAIGTANVGGTLTGTWAVGGGITSLSAAQVLNLNLDATFLETLTVKPNPKLVGTTGEVTNSTFNLSGNNGAAAGSYGLKTVTIAGTVNTSTFNIEEGNVKSFTVGRFINSALYLDYTATAPFDSAGAFASNAFNLGSFKTTAATIGNVNHPLHWAFAGSKIAAAKLGTVELSGLNTANTGDAFGIKYSQAGAVIKVKTASNNAVPLAPALINASLGAIADDFFVLDV